MGFYALTKRSYPVQLAWTADPAIDWWATATAMGIDEKPSIVAAAVWEEAKAVAESSAYAIAELGPEASREMQLAATRQARADAAILKDASAKLADARSDRCIAAIEKYGKGLDASLLVPKDGETITMFAVSALGEQERFDLRTQALGHCGNLGANSPSMDNLRVLEGLTADRMHVLCYQACVTPPPDVGLTDDVRAVLGEMALRLSISSISQELADDVGKSSAPGS